MIRKRASIKGIATSVLCDSDAPWEEEPSIQTAEASAPNSDAERAVLSDSEPIRQAPSRTRILDKLPLTRPRLHLVTATEEVGPTSGEKCDEASPGEVATKIAPPMIEETSPTEVQDTADCTPTSTLPARPSLGVNQEISDDLRARSPEQETEARERFGNNLPKDLLDEVDELYERVTSTMSPRVEMAERAMDLLSEARDLLLLGSASDFNIAERKINEAKLIVNRMEQCRRWSNSYGWGLLAYELTLFLLLVGAIIFDRAVAEWVSLVAGATAAGEAAKGMTLLFPPWNTMLWGGIGGVVGALYSLHWHIAELQDFDKQYSLWYIVQPFMGLILGGIVHLVIVTGMLALVPVPGADSTRVASAAAHWFPSLVACLAGFRQKFAYELLDNIMRALGRQPAPVSTTITRPNY